MIQFPLKTTGGEMFQLAVTKPSDIKGGAERFSGAYSGIKLDRHNRTPNDPIEPLAEIRISLTNPTVTEIIQLCAKECRDRIKRGDWLASTSLMEVHAVIAAGSALNVNENEIRVGVVEISLNIPVTPPAERLFTGGVGLGPQVEEKAA